MPKSALRPITCMTPGCGYTYEHKRMEGKAWRRERMLHVTTGECARRVQEYNDREIACRLQGGGVTMADVTESLLPLYALITQQADEVRELRERVERRLESRKKKKDYVERDSYPGPWPMNSAIDALSQFPDVCIVTKFREIMTKEYEHGWSWERAVGCWLHWMFDQCSSDPILLMRHDAVRFFNKSGKQQRTKLQFFRCFGKVVKDYETLDESMDAFFVGFWYPMVLECRKLTHFANHIMFEIPATEREKREFEEKVFPAHPYERAPDLQMDRRIAQVLYDVMQDRKAQRRAAAQDDEKSSPK